MSACVFSLPLATVQKYILNLAGVGSLASHDSPKHFHCCYCAGPLSYAFKYKLARGESFWRAFRKKQITLIIGNEMTPNRNVAAGVHVLAGNWPQSSYLIHTKQRRRHKRMHILRSQNPLSSLQRRMMQFEGMGLKNIKENQSLCCAPMLWSGFCGCVADGLQVVFLLFFFVFFFKYHREKKAVPAYVMFVIILIVGKFDHAVGALEHRESQIQLNWHIRC